MFKPTLRSLALTLVMSTLLPLAGCKKKEAADKSVADTSGIPPGAALPALQTTAAKLGFVAKLPADTEAFIQALNLPAHLEAMKKSTWAAEVNAFLDDKTPAPSAAQGAMPDFNRALTELSGRDFFVSLGKGGAKVLAAWQDMATINTEIQYVTMMQGTLGVSGGTKKTGFELMLAQLLSNPDLLKRAADVVSWLEVPPMMIGVQTDKPDQVLKELVPDALLSQLKTKARVSQVTLRSGGQFNLVEGTFAALLTDEIKKALLAALPPENTAAQAIIGKVLEEVQKKSFSLTYGSTEGHLIVAIGSTRPNIDFVTDPAKSLLARPDLGFIRPFAAKKLVAVAFVQADVLQAMQNPEPMQPIARGLLAGLQSSPMFGPMAKALEPKVAELATLERALQSSKLTAASAAMWWDQGLHLEMKGGQSPTGLQAGKPLKFAHLLDDPDTVAGVAYHGDPEMTGKVRKLVEGWAVLLHTAAQELVKAGFGGKDGPEIAKWVESDVMPEVVKFYDGSKTLFQKGVGDEHAWVIDLGGKMPPLPFFPQKSDQVPPKMLRIASLDDVTNRALIADNWDKMQVSLGKLAGAFPMLAGQKLPDPDVRNQPGGITSYSYMLMPGVDDFAPSASISGQWFMLGTSSSQHGDLAMRMLKGKPNPAVNTAVWRINFAAVREAVKTFSTTNAEPSQADQMKSSVKWLSPLGDMTGRMWIEAGNVRNSITIEVKDVLRYD